MASPAIPRDRRTDHRTAKRLDRGSIRIEPDVGAWITGHLIARFGVEKIVATGLLILAASGGVGLAGVELENFFIALILLGIGLSAL